MLFWKRDVTAVKIACGMFGPDRDLVERHDQVAIAKPVLSRTGDPAAVRP
jgi:hypothetical protein